MGPRAKMSCRPSLTPLFDPFSGISGIVLCQLKTWLQVQTILVMDPPVRLICLYPFAFIIFLLYLLKIPGTDPVLCSSYNYHVFTATLSSTSGGPSFLKPNLHSWHQIYFKATNCNSQKNKTSDTLLLLQTFCWIILQRKFNKQIWCWLW